jgi:hypothetical protein
VSERTTGDDGTTADDGSSYQTKHRTAKNKTSSTSIIRQLQTQRTSFEQPSSLWGLEKSFSMRSFILSWIVLVGLMLEIGRSFLASSLSIRIVHPAASSYHPTCSLIHRHAAASSEGDNTQEEPSQLLQDSQQVSDAEALLACYAYLKRRKRLENSTWTQKERRQRMKTAAQPHFFWEQDLSRIAARLQKQMQGDLMYDEDDEDDDDDNDDEHRETSLRPSRSSEAAAVWSGEFTSFPTEPSPTRARRSNSAKRTWTDPDFRERWYKSRWGDRRDQKEDPATIEDKELETKIRALPSGFLGSAELSDMTEEEIEDAIKIFVAMKGKQIQSRKNTLAERKAVLQKQMDQVTMGDPSVEETFVQLSRDSLFAPDEAALKEAQRKRSERAKKLYQKRLENSQQKAAAVDATKPSTKTPPPPPRKYQPSSATPQDAMLRIQRDLGSGVLPAGEDVKIVMEPGRVAKRRDVLRRILADFFDLRGKCVPIHRDDANPAGISEMEFVTKCAIDDLGALVIDLIRKENTKKKK